MLTPEQMAEYQALRPDLTPAQIGDVAWAYEQATKDRQRAVAARRAYEALEQEKARAAAAVMRERAEVLASMWTPLALSLAPALLIVRAGIGAQTGWNWKQHWRRGRGAHAPRWYDFHGPERYAGEWVR